MRKFFTTLKSVVAAAVIASMTFAASCSYDDSGINDRLNKVEKDIAALTERVANLEKKLADEVTALTALINGKTVVTSVETGADGVITVSLSDNTSFKVYPKSEATDTDTTIAPKKDEDGVYYWAIFNKGTFESYLLVDNAKVPVYNEAEGCDCVAAELKFKVDETTGNLLVSIDGGVTYVDSGFSAKAEATGACVFTDVVVNEDGTVTFTLADGTEFVVAQAELISFGIQSQVYVAAEQTKEVIFTAGKSVADIQVMNQPAGWSATVEPTEAPAEEEDEVDPGFGVLSEGLSADEVQYYLLKITAPAKEAVDAKAAHKNGDIALHINTVGGACKVAKLNVNLAEIALTVDKDGNITVTNSLSFYFPGNAVTPAGYQFTQYYIGICPLEYYEGELTEDLPIKGTYSTHFSNEPYVEGENELQVVETSVKYIIEEMYYGEMGTDSYLVFVAPMSEDGNQMYLDQAIVAEFKQLVANIELVKTTFNDAIINTTLKGAEAYEFSIVDVAEVPKYGFESVDDYLENYVLLSYSYGEGGFYTKIEEDIVDPAASVSNFINGEEEMWYYLKPNAEYVFVVLPIEDVTKPAAEYVLADLIQVPFKTADIVAAEGTIDYTLVLNEEKTDMFSIHVDVTLGEDVAYAYYYWMNEEMADVDALKEEILTKGYMLEYEYATNQANGPSTEKVLAFLVVNKNGEYVLTQTKYTTDAVVYSDAEVAIESVEFFVNEQGNGNARVTLSGIGEPEEGAELPENVKVIRTYVSSDNSAMTDDFLTPMSYNKITKSKSSYSNPYVITTEAVNYSSFVEGTKYYFAVAVEFNDGTVSRVVKGEYTYESQKFVADYSYSYDKLISVDGSKFVFGDGSDNFTLTFDSTDVVDGAPKVGTYTVGMVADAGLLNGNDCFANVAALGLTYPLYFGDGEVTVSAEGDVYSIVAQVKAYYDGGNKNFEFAFNGALEVAESEAEAMTVVSVVATDLYKARDVLGTIGVTYTMSNGKVYRLEFQTGYAADYATNMYITPGTWQANDYKSPNWISYVYDVLVPDNNLQNDNAMTMTSTVEVSYADGKYTIGEFTLFDYYGANVTYTIPSFTGAIEGLVAPVTE